MAEAGVPPESGPSMSRTMAVLLAVVLLVVGVGAGLGIGFVAFQPSYATTIEKIYGTGIMIVGMDAAFPPFESVNPDTNVIEGFDVDIIKEIASFMGVTADIRNIGWDPIFLAIPDRTIDVAISAMTITAERQQNMLFSIPYFESNLTLIIRAGGPMVGVINSIADLAGRSVAFQEFTTSDFWVDEVLVTEMGIVPGDIQKTVLFTDAVNLLIADEVDAVIIDKPVAEGFVGAGSVVIVETIITNEQFGIPMHLEEGVLKLLIDEALTQMVASGRYAEIFNAWFGP